jgi:hypothetical protein
MLLIPALVVALVGCAKPQERTAEVHSADGGRFYATMYHFLMAADDYDRASYGHGGEYCREDMARQFAGRPRVESVRVVEVEAPDDGSAVVTALAGYADGIEGMVKVALRKGDPAWLVDWPATRELGE